MQQRHAHGYQAPVTTLGCCVSLAAVAAATVVLVLAISLFAPVNAWAVVGALVVSLPFVLVGAWIDDRRHRRDVTEEIAEGIDSIFARHGIPAPRVVFLVVYGWPHIELRFAIDEDRRRAWESGAVAECKLAVLERFRDVRVRGQAFDANIAVEARVSASNSPTPWA